jgi:sugar phosphate isomerase/epimerase
LSSYDLMAACWTSAGACRPRDADDRSPLPILERVKAVADAGFTGFGIRHQDLLEVERTVGLVDFKKMLEDHGIKYSEVEFLEGWYLRPGPEREASDRQRADLLRGAEALGALHIKAGGRFDDPPFEPDLIAEDFHLLGQQAADAGTRVGFEPMPFADCKTPQDGLEVVLKADHPNAGLFLDVWHAGRAGVDFATLAEIPKEHIFSVEMSDADAEVRGTLIDDTFDERKFVGEGSLDIAGFVHAVKQTGYTGPWGVEMLSTDFRAMPVREATQKSYDTLITFLEADN